MEKDREKRYQAADEILADLIECEKRMLAKVKFPAVKKLLVPKEKKILSSRRWVISASLLVFAGAVGVGTLLFINRNRICLR